MEAKGSKEEQRNRENGMIVICKRVVYSPKL